jgi:hypothetical protein
LFIEKENIMQKNENINQFRQDEIANIRRWDKERNEYVTSPFIKVGGRLRLAHEQNEKLSIVTEIFKYDEKVAVVCAVSTTAKGSFKAIGMASIERDAKLAHAILELAETRAIARSLRFAGFGVEYCGAEEMSHTESNGSGSGSGSGNGSGGNGHQSRQKNDNLPPKGHCNSDDLPTGGNRNNSRPPVNGSGNGGSGSNNPGNGNDSSGGNGGNGGSDSGSNGNGNGGSNGNGNGNGDNNGNGRLSAKQYQYIQRLTKENNADLNKRCQEMYGTVAQHLSKIDASRMIEFLMAQ